MSTSPDRDPRMRERRGFIWSRLFLGLAAFVALIIVGVVILLVSLGGNESSSEGADVPGAAEVAATPQPTVAPVAVQEPTPTPTPEPEATSTPMPVPTPIPHIVEVEVIKEVLVERVVTKEVPVEVIKEVVKEVPVEVVKEVEVIKEVIKEVEVLVTPTPTPIPTPAPPPECEVKALDREEFGATYDGGLIVVGMLGGNSVNVAYAFHLNEGTNEISVAFALCDYRGELVGTGIVKDYRQGQELEYAEVTQYFPEAPERKYIYNRVEERVIMVQQFKFDSPVMHILSPEERVGGRNLNELLLYTRNVNTLVEFSFDDKGGVLVKITYTGTTAINRMENAFDSLQFLIDQIETKR